MSDNKHRYAVVLPNATVVIASDLNFYAYSKEIFEKITTGVPILFTGDDGNVSVIYTHEKGLPLVIMTLDKYKHLQNEAKYAAMQQGRFPQQ